MKKTLKLLTGALILLPPLASAHTIDGSLSHSFYHGLIHPLFGIDHLLILLAVGVLCNKFTHKKTVEFLFAFIALAMMAVGFIAGQAIGSFNMMEALIGGSMFVSALAVWKMTDESLLSKVLISATLLALSVHGWAHGVELGSASALSFASGMLLGSASIIGLGNLLTQLISSSKLASLIASSAFIVAIFG